ncbi:hypothetical protein SEA_NICEHOUSE_287 [Rhodococcus phage NiceHouse]|nr:hypothetical protein SEA_NICEHOUSE_6 [Rhodococcus phage NiceHouse]QLF83500.1 hypothetical protein SEA_NICEHOUSE_287 [Rhodococcus phage NiceHouse]
MAYNDIQRDDRTDDYLDEIYPAVTIGECEYLASTILFECDPIHYRMIQVELEPIESQSGSLGQRENDLFLASFLDQNTTNSDSVVWVNLVTLAYSDMETEYDPADVVSDMESEAENNGYRIEWNDGIEIFED